MPFASELKTGVDNWTTVPGDPTVFIAPRPGPSAHRPPPPKSSLKRPKITTEAPTPPITDGTTSPLASTLGASGSGFVPSSPELTRSPPSPVPGWAAAANAGIIPVGLQVPTTSAGYPVFLGHLGQLIPLQRALLLLNLQKAHLFYAEECHRRLAKLGWAEPSAPPATAVFDKVNEADVGERLDEQGELVEVKMLLDECGLWDVVEEAEREARAEVDDWAKRHEHVRDEFQIVQLGSVGATSSGVDKHASLSS